MNSKVIQYDKVGEIQLLKNRRTRGISLKIHPIKGICVSIPYYMSYKEAESFLLKNQAWVTASITKLSAIHKKSTPFTETTIFQMKYHEVKILPWIGEYVSYTLRLKLLTIFYPQKRNILDKDIQDQIRFRIEETYRKEAKVYLPVKVEAFANQHGFQYKKVSIKNMTSRWGSCSASNQISLSLHLLRIPEELCDYVILHELCHTIQKNHSKKFWELLAYVCIDAKHKDKEMRKYDAMVY